MNKLRYNLPIIMLIGCIVLGTILTYVLPAGQYERKKDPETGREIVVAESYHRMPQQPVNVFQMMLAVPKGIKDAGSVIMLVLMIGGAINVVNETGALKQAIIWLADKRQGTLVIPTVSLVFALGGVMVNTYEEIIGLIPVLLVLTRRLGFNALTAVAISMGTAAVGASFSPINPYQVGIAQKFAEVPPLSGAIFRSVFLLLALSIWVGGVMRYAAKTRVKSGIDERDEGGVFDWRKETVLGVVLCSFIINVYGVQYWDWDFKQSALFFMMGVVSGLIGGLGISGTARSFIKGLKSLAVAGAFIGLARAIFIVLKQGLIIDTIINALVTPLTGLHVTISALGMMVVHVLIHVPVPSVSGQAALTMPVLSPLSDAIGLSRQVTVLAYQYGAGLCDLITPTNGALMAVIAASGLRYNEWLKFLIPRCLILFGIGALAIVIGIAIGLD